MNNTHDQSLLDALKRADECFEAAYIEGLTEAISESTDERLKDLVTRRLLWARSSITNALQILNAANAAPVATTVPDDDGFESARRFLLGGMYEAPSVSADAEAFVELAKSVATVATAQSSMQELVAEAHKRIQAKLPEDEPDCVPDWICELLINLGLEARNAKS